MRTFVLILLAFVVGVAALVAALSWQGRAAREYGREVVGAVQREDGPSDRSYEVPCHEVLIQEPPATVQNCVVKVEAGRATVTVRLEGGRAFQIGP